MLRDLVQHLDEDGHTEIHSVYKRFIRNVSKPTSARGLLQVTYFLPLGYLEYFCNQELNLKDVEYLEELRTVTKELPVLWPMLNDN